jgi:AcrR family transcriptional regulator
MTVTHCLGCKQSYTCAMPDTAEPHLPRGVALAWGIAASPQRGPKREMSVERIVEAAVEIADADGLGAVSMAAVAARLGFTPMSLYRYVTAKEELVLLMQEEATGLPSEKLREGGWRARLETLYVEQVQQYLRHPWVLDVPISGSPATPNSAAWMDAGLAALADTELSHNDRLAVILLVTGHARWTGIVLAGYARVAREQHESDADITVREDALYRHLISAEDFPHLREAIDEGVFLDQSDPFAFGLARSLDGVESYLVALAEGRADAPRPWRVAE